MGIVGLLLVQGQRDDAHQQDHHRDVIEHQPKERVDVAPTEPGLASHYSSPNDGILPSLPGLGRPGKGQVLAGATSVKKSYAFL